MIKTEKKPTRIAVFLPTLGHPRHAKRVSMFKEAGFDVRVLAFERPYHSGRMPECPITILGKIDHGNYLSRAMKFAMAIGKMREGIRWCDLIYSFGPDLALTCQVAGAGLKKPLVFEVGDITRAQLGKGFKGKLVRKTDQYVANRSKTIISTSSKFIDVYYRDWVGTSTDGLVIENKLEASYCVKTRKEIPLESIPSNLATADNPLKIGYFGFLRNVWSLKVLSGLVNKYPERFEVLIAGHPIETATELLKEISTHPKINYLGPYNSPEDLLSLYGSVDMVWACYQPLKPDDWEYLWARPNRFYQACLFAKPIFTRAGCLDSEVIARLDIGKSIDTVEVDATVEKIASVNADDVIQWTKNIRVLPSSVFSYTDEVAKLKTRISKIVSGEADA